MTVAEGTGSQGTGAQGRGTRGTSTPVTRPPLEVRSQQGTVTATVELDAAMFGVQPNIPLMHQVVTAQLAAARSGTQSTKTRAEVSGGGAKPYRQKGTGRARQGSTRAPHYAGGGVALVPSRAATVSARREKWCSSPSAELSPTVPPQARWPW